MSARAITVYFRRIRGFSRNAKLLVLSDTLSSLGLWGIWSVVFNLYLLEVGFREDFIGYLLLAGSVAGGIAAVPGGLISDRIGRKNSLLIGRAAIPALGVIQAYTVDGTLLLASNLMWGFLSTTSWVVRAPFMMENSTRADRTYLFSVDSAATIVSSIAGSVVGGVMPTALKTLLFMDSVSAFRITLLTAVVLSGLSVVPLLMIGESRRHSDPRIRKEGETHIPRRTDRIILAELVVIGGLIGLGAGFIVNFFNVFFAEKLRATTEQIGLIFALGHIATAAGTLLAPMVARRFGKVRTVVYTQLLSIPFVFVMALSPDLSVVTLGFLFRGSLMNMSWPITDTLAMELVEAGERATTSGLRTMSDSVARGVSSGLAGRMMADRNYTLPYAMTALTYVVASVLFYIFFRKVEEVDISAEDLSSSVARTRDTE